MIRLDSVFLFLTSCVKSFFSLLGLEPLLLLFPHSSLSSGCFSFLSNVDCTLFPVSEFLFLYLSFIAFVETTKIILQNLVVDEGGLNALPTRY